jgi:hypothetical protein
VVVAHLRLARLHAPAVPPPVARLQHGPVDHLLVVRHLRARAVLRVARRQPAPAVLALLLRPVAVRVVVLRHCRSRHTPRRASMPTRN